MYAQYILGNRRAKGFSCSAYRGTYPKKASLASTLRTDQWVSGQMHANNARNTTSDPQIERFMDPELRIGKEPTNLHNPASCPEFLKFSPCSFCLPLHQKFRREGPTKQGSQKDKVPLWGVDAAAKLLFFGVQTKDLIQHAKLSTHNILLTDATMLQVLYQSILPSCS